MRRWLLALFTALAVCVCSGCSTLSALLPTDIPNPKQPLSYTDYSEEFEDRWCYRVLPAHLQPMYAALYAGVKECVADTPLTIRDSDGTECTYTGLKVTLPTPIVDTADARVLFHAFTTDNPAFFFVGNTYSYEGYRLAGTDYYDVFCLTFTMSAADRQTATAALDQAVNELLAALPAGTSDYEIERDLHDALASRVTYAQSVADGSSSSADHPAAFSAYGALVEGAAVCEGYARAMQLLLHRRGIPCTLVSGTAGGEAHMWNMVTVEGHNYHLDVTWDDAQDRLHHTYFNLSTADIERSHTIDEENQGVDTCVSTAANYYQREGRRLDTYDRSLIAEAVAAQVNTGATTVDLQFSEGTFATARLFFANSRQLKQYTAPFLDEAPLWDYLCQANDTHYTLTLFKEV